MNVICKDDADRIGKMRLAKDMIEGGYTHVRSDARGELVFCKPRYASAADGDISATLLTFQIKGKSAN